MLLYVCDYVSVSSLLASYFNIEQSHVQSDLAAMAISDNSEEYNEYEHFTRGRGNSTQMFMVQQSREDLWPLKTKSRPVRATDLLPAQVSTRESRPIHSKGALNFRRGRF